MQRAFFYSGLAGGGTVFVLSLAIVAALVINSLTAGAASADHDGNGQNGHSAPTEAPIVSDEPIGELDINAFDLGFEPANFEVPAPGVYTITFTNDGALPHDLAFEDGTATAVLDAGESEAIEVLVPAEGIAFICSVPGHEAGGMTGTITVAGSGYAGDTPGGPVADRVIEANDDAADYDLFDPVAPASSDQTVHEIELVMTERLMTVAPGYEQMVWTFGDTVPGPVIRARVGDMIRITLVNPEENELPHSIDFHSSLVAWNDEMRSINPGESLVYEFEAKYAGVYMYHCGTAPALHHIANGMYGMMIVEPAEGLPEVDHEFALVQSEWYLGEQGEVTDLARAAAGAPDPDFVVFNGVANQYLDHPIEVGVDETVRVFVLNAGPSVDSSFHVVGTIFHDVIKEGMHLREGNEGNWGSQAVDLAPAQGAIVEMRFDYDGLYPIVTHAFNFVGKGALGLFMAGDGGPDMAGGH
jgi:nitrite reductase (NO-forming)